MKKVRVTDNFIPVVSKHLKETLEQREKPIEDNSFIDSYNRKIRDDGLASTISTRTDAGNDTYIVLTKDTENYIEWKEKGKLDVDCRAFKEDKVNGTIMTTPKNKVLVKEATKQGYAIAQEGDSINIAQPNSNTRRGRVGKQVAQTLLTQPEQATFDDLRIRKLTPKECFRLMGVKDEDYERIAKNQSNASLYHLAGDSIVVNVLMAIFKEMIGE